MDRELDASVAEFMTMLKTGSMRRVALALRDKRAGGKGQDLEKGDVQIFVGRQGGFRKYVH